MTALPATAPAVAVQPPEGHVAPGTQIHYSPELLIRFKADRQRLLGLFGAVKAAAHSA